MMRIGVTLASATVSIGTACRPAAAPTPAPAPRSAPSSTTPAPAETEAETEPAPASGPIAPVTILVHPIPTSTEGPPSPRTEHYAAWTGTQMLIWGGDDAVPSERNGYAPVPPHPLGTGGRYDPATDHWTPLPAAPIAPRFAGAAVWTGHALLVWGGRGPKGTLRDGASFDPATNAWTRVPSKHAPRARERMAFAWTSTALLVWGGEAENGQPLGDGALYDPAAHTWTSLPSTGAPSPRAGAHAVAIGDDVMVWGGTVGDTWRADGAIFEGEGRWRPLSTDGAPTLADPVMVWTGTEVLVWSGSGDEGTQARGSRYDPAADRWTPMGTDGAFVRDNPQGLWTGRRLLVLGEVIDDDMVQDELTLGIYDPALDRWWNANGGYPMYDSSLVWTGRELISWGGFDGNNDTWEGVRLPVPPPP